MHRAVLAALTLHALLLLFSPPIKTWYLPSVDSGFRLNVLLEKKESDFDQSLNYPSNDPTHQASQTSSLNIASPAPGDDEQESNQSDEVTGASSDAVETQAVGLDVNNSISPKVLFSYSSVLKFAQQEAVRFADANPTKLQRFNRSFNSRRQYQRRKKTNSHKNQYGDQYVQAGSSNGDICFVKTAEPASSIPGTLDASTYTVHFFRCKEKSQGLKSLGG